MLLYLDNSVLNCPFDDQRRVRSHPTQEILLCSVVKAELGHGAEKYGNRERRLRALDRFFDEFVSLPFDDDCALHYADIRHRLELQGTPIGPNDLKIAAIARAHALTIVTRNFTEFGRVPGLKVKDWE